MVVGDHFLSRLTSLLFLMPDSVPTPGNRRYLAAVRELDRLVYRIIEEHATDDVLRQARDERSLLSMLLAARVTEDGAGLSDEEIRDEVMTFFLAGHETTALALTWALYLLSKAPHARERLYREVEDVLDGRRPTVDDVGRLPYTRCRRGRGAAAVPAGVLARPRGAARLRHRRPSDQARHDGAHEPVGHPSRSAVLRRAERLCARTLAGRHAAQAPAALRVLPVRRRPTPVHRHAASPNWRRC